MRNSPDRLGLGRPACVLAAIGLMVGNCSRVAGRTNVFEGKVDTEGQLLRVDGAALEFELIKALN